MILTLEGYPTDVIERGQEYLVPTIEGLPVVVPSHVDEGNEGPTSRHYHVDKRFYDTLIPIDKVDPWWYETVAVPQVGREGGQLNVPTILDDGRAWEYQKHKACHPRTMSGEVFGSLVWLYMKLGETPARDGRCPHHQTELSYVPHEGCMVCPAHGLRFHPDGSPKYKAPFWLRLGERVPISLDPEFRDWKGHNFILEDDRGETISSMWLNAPKKEREGDTLRVHVHAWEKSQGAPCTLRGNLDTPAVGIPVNITINGLPSYSPGCAAMRSY